MSTTHSIRTVSMASKGNLALYASGAPGTAVYATPSAYGEDDAAILVPPGQYVAMDAKTKLSLDHTATMTSNPFLKLGLAIDLNDDGISDIIRWVFDTSGAAGAPTVTSLLTEKAVCGVSNIWDIFPRCVKCGETYTLQIRAFAPNLDPYASSPGIGNVYDFSFTMPCGGCDDGDCPPEVNADILMCGLANIVDGKNPDPGWDIRLNSMPFEVQKHKYPFTLSQLYNTGNTWYKYCLSDSDGTCVNCVNMPDIGGISSETGGFDVTFTGTYVTENATKVSKRAHWERAVGLMNAALAGKGKAVFLPAVGFCCDNHVLDINSCLTDLVIKDGDGNPISPCDGWPKSPYSNVTIYGECQNCDSSNETWTPTIGWRVYSKPMEGRCGCVADNFALAEYYSEVEVFPKFGFDGVWKNEIQVATMTLGQGFQWQGVELYHLEEYAGENFVEDNYNGKHGEPEMNDRLKHATFQCRESYGIITMQFTVPIRRDVSGRTHNPQITLNLGVPTADTVTRDSMIQFFNAYYAVDGIPDVSLS